MKPAALLLPALLAVGCASQPKQDHWLILETTESGRPIVLSARDKMPAESVRREFRWATTVEWYYPVVGRGMPSEQVLKTMYEFESRVESAVVATQLSMHAVTRTGNGLREWTYYAKERRVAEEQIATLAKASPAEGIRVKVREEPEWTALHAVLSNIREAKK